MTGPMFVVQMHLQVLPLHILPAEHSDRESNRDFVMTGCSALSIEILRPTGEQVILRSFKIDPMVEMI